MRCPNCHTDNPSGAEKCSACGAKLSTAGSEALLNETEIAVEPAPTAAGAYDPGTLISSRFEVVRELGRGGMGMVLLVKDMKLHGKEVALKLIADEYVAHPEAEKRFVQEVLAAQELTHTNIVKVFHLDDHHGQHFFTMEHVPGRSLREIVEERKAAGRTFSLDEACGVIRPVLAALKEAHSHKVIHRDLKPDNIIVDGELSGNPQVKVLDFGLAKLMSPSKLTSTAISMGTAYYMAPEQLQGAKDVDHRADIFSVGVVVYEMLTGEIPSGRFQLPGEMVDGVPKLMDDLVDKALQQRPANRYQSVAELAEALEAAAVALVQEAEPEPEPIPEPEPTPEPVSVPTPDPQPEQPEQKKKSGLFIGLAAAVLVLVVAVFFLLPLGDDVAEVVEAPVSKKVVEKAATEPEPVAEKTVAAPKPEPKPAPESAPEPSPPPKSTKYAFTLKSEPSDAEIRFLNLNKPYNPGMELSPGMYRLEVAKQGYNPQIVTATVADNDVVKRVSLERVLHLTVETTPKDAIIKLLNIGPKYKPGIALKPGKYHVEVAAKGYNRNRQWVELTDTDVTLLVELVRELKKVNNYVIVTAKDDGSCWMEVRKDGAPVKEYFVQKGQEIQCVYDRSLWIRLGNAGGVTMLHNGKVYPLNSRKGQVKTIVFP